MVKFLIFIADLLIIAAALILYGTAVLLDTMIEEIRALQNWLHRK